jgi:hypothetical protein
MPADTDVLEVLDEVINVTRNLTRQVVKSKLGPVYIAMAPSISVTCKKFFRSSSTKQLQKKLMAKTGVYDEDVKIDLDKALRRAMPAYIRLVFLQYAWYLPFGVAEGLPESFFQQSPEYFKQGAIGKDKWKYIVAVLGASLVSILILLRKKLATLFGKIKAKFIRRRKFNKFRKMTRVDVNNWAASFAEECSALENVWQAELKKSFGDKLGEFGSNASYFRADGQFIEDLGTLLYAAISEQLPQK